jgi:hypothetical protein
MTKKYLIRLGRPRFALSRTGLELLGTVQRGLQIGALARTSTGNYVQVNGDIIQSLNTAQVERALRHAEQDGGRGAVPVPSRNDLLPRGAPAADTEPMGLAPPQERATACMAAPVVTVKPRRRLVMPGADRPR